MRIGEKMEMVRTKTREHRMALIEAEYAAAIVKNENSPSPSVPPKDAVAIVKNENTPPPTVQPKDELLRPIAPTYPGLKPAKKRKFTGKLTLSHGCRGIPC